MTNATKVLYVFFVYLVTAYGEDDFNDILNEYKNIIETKVYPTYVPQRQNPQNVVFQNPQNSFQYDYQPYPFPYSRGDLEYDLRLQRVVQPILRQLQELINVIKNLHMTRYQPAYFPPPVPFYPKTENDMFRGDSAGVIIPVSNRFPQNDDDSNKVWGIVEENAANNETNSKCNCKNANDLARMSNLANYMNAIDTPTRCKAATLSCCIKGYTERQREDCFDAQRCQKIYKTGYACSPRIIRAVYNQLYGIKCD